MDSKNKDHPNHFGAKHTYDMLSPFKLDIYPYAAPPEALNELSERAILQYGADFKVHFTRSTTSGFKIGLIQLIWPQTNLSRKTLKKNAWNIDKKEPNSSLPTMERCFYGEDNEKIGGQSKEYHTWPKRHHSPTDCYLIDTPRELIQKGFGKDGKFTGETTTKFANYVVESDGSEHGKIFNSGIQWEYSFYQDNDDLLEFQATITEPIQVHLMENDEHLQAITDFLNIGKDPIKDKKLMVTTESIIESLSM